MDRGEILWLLVPRINIEDASWAVNSFKSNLVTVLIQIRNHLPNHDRNKYLGILR